MAVIQSNGFIGVAAFSDNDIDYSVNIDLLQQSDTSPPNAPLLTSESGYVTIVSNVPISPIPLASTAVRARSFLDDYYNRIHMNPKHIDLGNLLSVQTQDVEVWNAYLDAQILSDIVSSGTDGITLTEPQLTPTSFAALEIRTYSLNISTSGSPIIDASYVFSFALESVELTIVGRRVVVWPYKPKYPFKEQYEWKTDIIQAFNSEQRIRLRDAPRQSYSFESVISLTDYTKARALAFQWVHRVFGAPAWIDMRYVESIAAGSMYIDVSTSNADFRSYDIIMIWSDNDYFEAIETDVVTASRINLKQPVISTYTKAYVVPVRYANALKGINFSRDSDAIISVDADFSVRNNANLSAATNLPQYKGKSVFTDVVLSSDASTDKYTRSMDIFDNGSGPIEIDVRTNYVNIVTRVSLKVFGAAAVWRYKNFFHSLYGRQKTFFIPSWHDDFIVLTDIGSTSSTIKIQNIGYTLYYSNQFIVIETTTGVYSFNKITGSSIDVDGSEILNLEVSFGVAITAASIKRAGILKHVRLDTDQLELNHSVAGECDISFPIREVPYVV